MALPLLALPAITALSSVGGGAAIGSTVGAGALAAGAGAATTGALGAGGLSGGLMGSSALTPTINAAAAGNGLVGATTTGIGSGSAIPGTYAAAMGNPVAGSVPLSALKPVGSGLMGSGSQSTLAKLLADPRLKKMMNTAGQMGGGVAQQQPRISAPQLMRGPVVPFQPFQFSRANYQFRR